MRIDLVVEQRHPVVVHAGGVNSRHPVEHRERGGLAGRFPGGVGDGEGVLTGVAGLDGLEFQRGAGGIGNILPVQLPLVGKRTAAVGCSPEGNRVAFRRSGGDRLSGDARRRALGRQFLGGAVQLDTDTGRVDARRRIVDLEVDGVDALDKPGSDFEPGESTEAAGGFDAGTFVVEQDVWATVIRGPLAGDGCRLVIEFGQVERDPI